MDASSPRPLTFAEVGDILRLAASEPPDVVLIGGQALNYWAEHYLDASPLLRAEAPFASGDIDFLRGLPTAERLARLLPGRLHLGTVYDSGVTIAAIEYRDSDNDPRVIHFLGRMHGVDPNSE